MVRAAGLLAFTALAIFVSGFGESQAAIEKRVALVIGNSSYKHVSKLPNPSRDASAISAMLKKAGFDVVESRDNLGINDMRRAMRDFSDKTRDADIAVVFYAGHGIEVDGTNYLIPVDASLERDIDVEDEALPLDRIVKILEPVKRLRLVILDACRDNPFMKSMKRTVASRSIGRGLAKVEVQMSDTLIAFAAKAGSTAADGDGGNSPFTTALLNNIATPGLDLRLAFGRVRDEVLKSTGNKQEPFVYGSLGGTTVALVPPLPTPAPVVAAPKPAPAPAVNTQAEMRRDYELAGQIGTKEAWDQFLAVYETGLYAGLARAARAKLIAEEAKADAEIKAVKAKAEAEVKTARTRAEAEAKAAAIKADTEAKAALQRAEANVKAATKADADAKAAAANANIVVAAATPSAPVEAAKPVIDPSQTIRLLQIELRRVGCYPGAVNGDWNSDSRRALELFNRHAGMRLDVKVASLDVVDVVKGKSSRICPLQCDRGYKADGDACMKITCPAGQVIGDDNTCEKPKEKPRSASRPEPSRPAADRPAASSSGGGKVICGPGGCQEAGKGACVLERTPTGSKYTCN